MDSHEKLGGERELPSKLGSLIRMAYASIMPYNLMAFKVKVNATRKVR